MVVISSRKFLKYSVKTVFAFFNQSRAIGRKLPKETVCSSSHTGGFALKIISNDAILLVKFISTTFVHLGSSRVSNEAKNFKEFEFLGFSRCFSARIE